MTPPLHELGMEGWKKYLESTEGEANRQTEALVHYYFNLNQDQKKYINLAFDLVGGVKDLPQEIAMSQLSGMWIKHAAELRKTGGKQLPPLTESTLKNLQLPLALADVQARIAANGRPISSKTMLDYHEKVFEDKLNLPRATWRGTVFDNAVGRDIFMVSGGGSKYEGGGLNPDRIKPFLRELTDVGRAIHSDFPKLVNLMQQDPLLPSTLARHPIKLAKFAYNTLQNIKGESKLLAQSIGQGIIEVACARCIKGVHQNGGVLDYTSLESRMEILRRGLQTAAVARAGGGFSGPPAPELPDLVAFRCAKLAVKYTLIKRFVDIDLTSSAASVQQGLFPGEPMQPAVKDYIDQIAGGSSRINQKYIGPTPFICNNAYTCPQGTAASNPLGSASFIASDSTPLCYTPFNPRFFAPPPDGSHTERLNSYRVPPRMTEDAGSSEYTYSKTSIPSFDAQEDTNYFHGGRTFSFSHAHPVSQGGSGFKVGNVTVRPQIYESRSGGIGVGVNIGMEISCLVM